MTNQVMLIGRLVTDLEIKEEENAKVTRLTLAVTRSWKNAEGEFETDFIPITLWNNIASATVEYCKKGYLIGIKGRIQTNSDTTISIIAERVTFLSSTNKE